MERLEDNKYPCQDTMNPKIALFARPIFERRVTIIFWNSKDEDVYFLL
jgi:hypothetical protein